MSLRPENRSSRSGNTSATRDRSRSRSNVQAPAAPSPPYGSGYGYAPPPSSSSAMPGSFGDRPRSPTYEVRSPGSGGAANYQSGYFPPPPPPVTQPRYAPPASKYQPPPNHPYPSGDDGFTMGDYKDFPPHERPGYVPPGGHYPQSPSHDDDGLAYGDAARQHSYGDQHQAQYPGQQSEGRTNPNYRYTPQQQHNDSRSASYNYQYAQAPEKVTYTAKPQSGPLPMQYTQTPQSQQGGQLSRTYSQGTYSQNAQVVDMTPGHDRRDRTSSTSNVHRPSLSTQQHDSSSGLRAGMNRLSVSGNRPDLQVLGGGGDGHVPPPSPLLEAYHGTWQSISPMPLAIRAADDDDDLSDLEPLSPVLSRQSSKGNDKLSREAQREKGKKTVKLYHAQAEEDAKKIAAAMGRSKIDADAIIDVIPGLTHDQIWELRKEYKKQVKIQGKGINLPKHLKMKLTGNFGKAVYVTALGRWESEGYWANFWYQSHGSRRELLIESLMGRTNGEIGYIKEEFKDKRYSDSLVKCMEKELKMDKFRTAILMALEERRQEEQDVYPAEYRGRDVDGLHRALTAKQGGETAMLEVIIRRSDAHLREVLRTYEQVHHENFARAALKKSNNLVGEVIAHILNGVINKPARDALLIHHALKDIAAKNKDDDLRYELLISRLVRLHWDRAHLSRVKREYADKFRNDLQQDIEDATKGDFREFMCELCETR